MSVDRAVARAAALTPSPRQLKWQTLELTGFVHFGINTFTGQEWGEGNEDPARFYPTQLDCNQWAKTFRDAGLRMLILTTKHHDGFCLWPSQYTDHSVKRSAWRGGEGDVVAECAAACREHGIKFGLYLSPWDRHEPTYGDSPAYNEFYRNQLRELLTNYGPIAEVWFDGACGEGADGRKQEYDWESYFRLVRDMQPDAAIFNGPDVRWVGNEDGLARETEWSVVPRLDRDGNPLNYSFVDFPHLARQIGTREQIAEADDLMWYPAEADVSIRPSWFYHAEEDLMVKSVERLMEIYYRSVGRNAQLLLNVPPDARGLIHDLDVARLMTFKAAREQLLANDLTKGAKAKCDEAEAARPAQALLDGNEATWFQPKRGQTQATVEIDLGEERTFNRVLLQEMITGGQRVERWALDGQHNGKWKPIVLGTTIGYKRIDRFGEVTLRNVRLRIEESRAEPMVRRLALFHDAFRPV